VHVVIQSAAFDGLGRRVKKVVTNSGDLDGTTVYLYHGQQIIETRDGSGNVELQVYHGTRYIDEVVGLRVKDVGRLYASQDANWNVTALTDLTGRVIERYWYSPYGELEAVVAAHPFDYDDDGDVDADDYAVTTNGTCSGTATGDCRRLDANADGVVNSTDRTAIAAYLATLDSDTELQRVPAATHSRRRNLFAHQGLVLDPEIGSYQNRARQYAPRAKRFMQRDPTALDEMSGRGYQDGPCLYAYMRSRPVVLRDPFGSSACWADPCLQAKLFGLDVGSEGDDVGGVICADGVKVSCFWGWNAHSDWNQVPAIRRCVLKHEDVHHGQSSCPCSTGLCRSQFPFGDDHARECQAFKVELACAEKAASECDNYVLPECQLIRDYVEDTRIGKVKKCGS